MFKKNMNNCKYMWCKGTVIKRLGKVLYLIKDHVTSSDVKKHKNQIVLCKGTSRPVDLDDSMLDSEPSVSQSLDSGEGRRNEVELSSSPTLQNSRCSSRLLRDIPRVDYKQFF
ncbi:hypothetical protein PYW08_013002 [Mythimna loreyi]|uniref:Uncharacterized protein n=1 Tax=Mythimna loreyi TaxID=667449 RepID=A0ACC2PZL4_9NEOP|nr:hypothetical protein PYW08_013002 [Mythimna loreyi]